MKVIDTIRRALATAGLDAHAGPIQDVAATIERALSAAGLGSGSITATRRETVIDAVASATRRSNPLAHPAPGGPDANGKPAGEGEFLSRSYSNDAGTRGYKLYVPAGYSAGRVDNWPLLVMLHGCTQSPDDFAVGTQMNALADRHGFLVVYPEQAANANGSRCWNWFQPGDQQRDRGEPSLIAGITREVAAGYHVDGHRVFVAGLSAGAAMAVILGATYPDVYAAVGAHSGLAHGAAHDMPSAFAAMKGRPIEAGAHRRARPPAAGRADRRRVPTIVFHGDRDHTVNVGNAEVIVAQAIAGRAGDIPLRATVHAGIGSGGRTHRQTAYVDADNRPVVEQWLLHGAGHAWSGGSPDGSFTDANGPDASAEMLRFFQTQSRAGRE